VAGIGAGVLTVMGAGAVGIGYASTGIPNPESSALQQASSVYYSNGTTLIGRFGSTNRVVLNINQIPKVVQDAVVAAEDKNFYHEGGISPTGILRAAYYDLTSSGGSLQGGSTITQQLVRNYYDNIGTAQTISRKIKEIFVAQKLAQVKSKQWILEQYLNTVYFGANGPGTGAYGIGAAAQTFFGITPAHLSRITPAQAAMLAAMIQSPSYYSPNPKAGAAYQGLVFRWKYVLRAMNEMGTLSQGQYAAALAKFPRVIKPVNNSWSGYTGYLMRAVYRELRSTYHYSDYKINNSGLRVVTTFQPKLQRDLYATVSRMRTLMRNCTPPSTALTGGGNVAAYGYSCTPYARWRKWVNIGAVLEQPGSGAILAMYGGPNYATQPYDDALVARNQVGSSFKPYVLATAVSEGMNVKTSLLNGYSPLYIPPISQPLVYASQKPHTTGGWYGPIVNDETVPSQGPVPVYKATAESLNTAFTDLYHRVAEPTGSGPDKVVAMAKSFGVNVGSYPNGSGLQDMSGEVGIALGQASLTVGEQANTIATLADGGTYYQPHVIKKVIVPSPATGTSQVQTASPGAHQVLTPQQAADVDWALSFDTVPGLGTAPYQGMDNGQPIIAKTGTTNLAQQAFFMAATPRYAMAVGMFVTDNRCPKVLQQQCTSKSALSYAPPMGHGMQTLFGVGGLAGYGGGWPAAIWHAYFNQEFSSLPVQQWPPLNLTGMSTWNLVGKLPPKPKPHPTLKLPGQMACQRHPFRHRCQAVPTPSYPSPSPIPTSSGCLPPFQQCPSPKPTPQSAGTPTAVSS
jgi:membrane peptidoglycan carboxypeptidase